MRFKKRLTLESNMGPIDMAPLIDCIFQLLIFFMLTSSFIVSSGINIQLPKAVNSQELTQHAINIVISSEDIVYMDNKAVTIGEIEAVLKNGKYPVINIKSDRDASMGVVVKIWDICKKLGINQVNIATTR